jgi:hypothetical protein
MAWHLVGPILCGPHGDGHSLAAGCLFLIVVCSF